MKNYLSILLLTLTSILGFHSAYAADWYLYYKGSGTSVKLNAANDPDLYYIDINDLGEYTAFIIRDGDWNKYGTTGWSNRNINKEQSYELTYFNSYDTNDTDCLYNNGAWSHVRIYFIPSSKTLYATEQWYVAYSDGSKEAITPISKSSYTNLKLVKSTLDKGKKFYITSSGKTNKYGSYTDNYLIPSSDYSTTSGDYIQESYNTKPDGSHNKYFEISQKLTDAYISINVNSNDNNDSPIVVSGKKVPSIADGWYLVGGPNEAATWKPAAAYKFTGSGNEYTLNVSGNIFNPFKIVYVRNGAEQWTTSFGRTGDKKIEEGTVYTATANGSNISFDGTLSNKGITINTKDKTILIGEEKVEGSKWYIMGKRFGDTGMEMKKLPEVDLQGNAVYSIELATVDADENFWFKCDNGQVIYAQKTTRPLDCESEKWAKGCDDTTIPFSSSTDYEKVKVYIRPLSSSVIMTYKDSDFNPYYTETTVGEGAGEIVWFAGTAYPFIDKVEFLLTKTVGGTETVEVWDRSKGQQYWETLEGFYGKVIDKIDNYNDVQIKVTFTTDKTYNVDGVTVENIWDAKDSNIATFGLSKDYRSCAEAETANGAWYKYILGAFETDKSGKYAGDAYDGAKTVVYQSYLTPADFRKYNTGDKTQILLKGENFNLFENGSNLEVTWNFDDEKDKKSIESLYNGVASMHIKPVDNKRPQFKMSWIPVFKVIEDLGINITDTNHKRAWTTFNLGLIGGYGSNDLGDNKSASFINFLSPTLFNNYSQLNMTWDNDTEAGKFGNYTVSKDDIYIIVDTDSRFRSMTILPYNPQVTLSDLNPKHERHDFALYDPTADVTRHDLKGANEVSAYARPSHLNKLSAGVKVRPAYLNLEKEEDQLMIRSRFTIDYYFYDCKHVDPGKSESTSSSHDGDRLIGVYETDKSEGSLKPSLTGITNFDINNITMADQLQMMLQAVYRFDQYEELSVQDGKHPAIGFRTIPHAVSLGEGSYTSRTVKLADKAAFLHLFEDTTHEKGGYSLHFDVPIEVTGKETGENVMASYMEYEVYIGDEEYTDLEPAWEGEGMPNIFTQGQTHWNWAIEGYQPYTGGDYDDNVHNWSKLMLDKKHINAVVHINAPSYDVLGKLINENGLKLVVRMKYPFKRYREQTISRGSTSTASYAPRREGENTEPQYSVLYSTREVEATYGKEGQGGVITGIENVAAEAETAEAEYYTLQGIRVSGALQPGVYVVRRGNNVTKELIK